MKKTPGSTKPFEGSCADLNWSVTEYCHGIGVRGRGRARARVQGRVRVIGLGLALGLG